MTPSWLDSARAEPDARPKPQARARTLALLFLGGGLLGSVTLVLFPVPAGTDTAGAAVTVGLGLAAAVVLLRWADRLPGWGIPVALAMGTLFVSLDIFFAGDIRTNDEMFYLWVAFYAFYFLPRRLASLELGLIGVSYALVLVLRHESDASARWVIAMGTLSMAAALTARLVRQLESWVAHNGEHQAALREAEERFRSTFEDASVGMAIVDLKGNWLRVNDALARLLGYSTAELSGMGFRDLTPADDVDQDEGALEALVSGQRAAYQREKRYQRADGSIVWVLLSVSAVRDDHGRPIHLISQMQDVTDRKAAEHELADRALHDPLTGLPNRLLFLDRVQMALARAARSGQPVAVFFIDLDGFKLVNDSLGHPVGDRMLLDAGQRLRSALRPSDTVSRFGGDEFTILCENVDETAAGLVAQRIGETMSEPFKAESRELFVGASIGVSIGRGLGTTPEAMLRDADVAMYRAKEKGRGRFVVFDGAMRLRATERLDLESDLRRALERDELRLHYQPLVELADGAISGVEALVRWEHPQRGLLAPDLFIPVAEESGLISELGRWVILTACRQASAWRRAGYDLEMSINLSPLQLSEPDLPEAIEGIIRQTGACAERISFEITERAAVESGLAPLEALKALGVTLAIDDFGTGFSSLNQIRQLPPVDVVKIDRSFTFELGRGKAETAIVAAITSIARSLDLRVIAEGIESQEVVQRLLDLGCQRGQGFYFSRPVEAAGIEALLEHDPRVGAYRGSEEPELPRRLAVTG